MVKNVKEIWVIIKKVFEVVKHFEDKVEVVTDVIKKSKPVSVSVSISAGIWVDTLYHKEEVAKILSALHNLEALFIEDVVTSDSN